VNTATTFTVTVAGDATASIQSYQWRFNGVGTSDDSEDTTTGPAITKTFTTAGAMSVTVTATTTDGRIAGDVLDITVVP
jgi:PKD repeat protein